MTGTKLLIIGIVCFLILILILRIAAENDLVTGGIDYANLEEQIAMLKRANAILREEVYRESALMTIEQKAEKKGFIPVGDPIYILQ